MYRTGPTTRRRRIGVAAIGALLSVGLVAACGGDDGGDGGSEGGQSTLDKIKEQGYVTVGFANERPYGYREDGELVGEAPAVQGEIFKRIGDIEIRGKQYDFNSLIPALNAGEVDVVTAGMFITPERCQQAAFSNPVYVAPTALLVEKGNPENLTDYESVAESDATLAVMSGAVEVTDSQAAGVEESNQQVVPDQESGLAAVKSGRADAFALTSISLNSLAEGEDSVEVTDAFRPVVDGEETFGAGAAVFRPEDNELREAFNEELANLLEDGKTWENLVGEYGFTTSERPDPGLTAEEICAG